MLTKEQVLKQLSKYDTVGEGKIIFKVLDYSGNPLAPERTAYRLYYTDTTGCRRKVTYYPDSVGFQWSR
jgi:hypothetical protein